LNDGSFVPGQQASAAVLGAFSPTLKRADSSRLWTGQVKAGTELAWPALDAPLSLALGLDYFRRTQHATAPAQVAAGRMSGVSNGFTIGTQRVGAAYAEVVAPVTKALELTGAFRYDHDDVSGGRANPKVGFKLRPMPGLLLRGTASRGFRAPGPAENGTAGLTILAGAIDDPVLCASGDPTTAGSFPTQCVINVGTIQSTTKTLKPETSTAFTLGLIVEPIDRLSVSVDLYRIELKNQIVPGGSGELVRGTNLTAIPQVQADGSTLDVIPPVAPIAYTTAGYVNANSTTVAGLDLGVRYQRRLAGVGDYSTELMWSYTSQYDLTIDGATHRLAGTHGPFTMSGNTGNPRSRIQWSHTLAHEDWSLTATINHIGSFGLTDPSYVDPAGNRYDTCYRALDGNWASTIFSEEYSAGNVPRGARCRVASFTSVNLHGRYRVSKHLSVRGSVTNLLNRRYPDDWNTYGQQTLAPYNPSLHAAGAIGRYVSLGASYTF
jgi:iron complex outermembrane receptor protein